jgi:GNAT superfamily N-acetyltransferase
VFAKCLDKLRLPEPTNTSGSSHRIKLGSNPPRPVRGLQGTRLGLVELEQVKFEEGCSFEEFRKHIERMGLYTREGELEKLETMLGNKLLNLIVWRENGKIFGHAIWHESNTEEHRKGDPRDEEDRKALHRFYGGKRDFVELHDVWLAKEHRGKGHGKPFFGFFEQLMRDKGYDSIIYYSDHPAALAICRKRGYKEDYLPRLNEYIFYLPLRRKE